MELEKYIKLFKDVGLTEREAKIYTALLAKRMFTASEIQEATNIPRTKIYEVIQKMINRGICFERRLGRNKVFEAVKPEIAFNQLYENYEKELQKKQHKFNSLIEILTPLYDEGKSEDNPLEYIEVFTDKNKIHQKYISLLNQTNFELLTLNKKPYSYNTPEKLKEQDRAEIKFLERGGVHKGLYVFDELLTDNSLFESVNGLLKIGHNAKYMDDLPVKMLVFDGKKVMMALDEINSNNNNLTMIVIEHVSVANANKILFTHLWSCATDVSKILNN